MHWRRNLVRVGDAILVVCNVFSILGPHERPHSLTSINTNAGTILVSLGSFPYICHDQDSGKRGKLVMGDHL